MRGIQQFIQPLRQALVALLAAFVFLTGLPIASAQAAPANDADRGSDVTRASDTTYKGRNIIQDNRENVDKATIKKIQREAEDLGDSPERPIGDTGLKNIRKLGENIPETLDLKARQTRDIYAPQGSETRRTLDKVGNAVDDRNVFEKAKDKLGDAVDNLK